MGEDLTPYKIREFREFLNIVGGNQVFEHWQQIADSLGVSVDTITDWKKTSEFEKARLAGIKRSLENMEKAGANDWKMWREKAKMLGLKDSEIELSIKIRDEDKLVKELRELFNVQQGEDHLRPGQGKNHKEMTR